MHAHVSLATRRHAEGDDGLAHMRQEHQRVTEAMAISHHIQQLLLMSRLRAHQPQADPAALPFPQPLREGQAARGRGFRTGAGARGAAPSSSPWGALWRWRLRAQPHPGAGQQRGEEEHGASTGPGAQGVQQVQQAAEGTGPGRQPHICLVVRTYHAHGPGAGGGGRPGALRVLLESLRVSGHEAWEALLVVVDGKPFPGLDAMLREMGDARVRLHTLKVGPGEAARCAQLSTGASCQLVAAARG